MHCKAMDAVQFCRHEGDATVHGTNLDVYWPVVVDAPVCNFASAEQQYVNGMCLLYR